jgi:hypothetical protein
MGTFDDSYFLINLFIFWWQFFAIVFVAAQIGGFATVELVLTRKLNTENVSMNVWWERFLLPPQFVLT